MTNKTNVLVTGGAGFIGSNLVGYLCSEVESVGSITVVDNLCSGFLDNIPSSPKISFIRGDVRDSALLTRVMDNVNIVFHLAACTSVQESLENPVSHFSNNVTGTLRLLEAAHRKKVDRFVFVSSCAVYGNQKRLPIPEAAPYAPISPYGESKMLAEKFVELFSQCHGLKCLILRLFNVYGWRQHIDYGHANVISNFVNAVRNGKAIVIEGTGKQTRDFIHVSDAVRALSRAGLCMEIPKNQNVLNIGSGIEISMLDLVSIIQEISGVSVPVQFVPSRRREISRSVADISQSVALLGHSSSISLPSGSAALWHSMTNEQEHQPVKGWS